MSWIALCVQSLSQRTADRLAQGVRALDWEQLKLRLDGDDSRPPIGFDAVLVKVADGGRMIGIGQTSAYELDHAGELEVVHIRGRRVCRSRRSMPMSIAFGDRVVSVHRREGSRGPSYEVRHRAPDG